MSHDQPEKPNRKEHDQLKETDALNNFLYWTDNSDLKDNDKSNSSENSRYRPKLMQYTIKYPVG